MIEFLHVEAASEIAPTFPIEIYCSAGKNGGIGWLVNPAGVERWRPWPKPFLEQHFIPQQHIDTYGTRPDEVCRDLAARTPPSGLYSLRPARDTELLSELYQTALGIDNPIALHDATVMFLEILSSGGHVRKEAESLLDDIMKEVSQARPVRDGAFAIPWLQAILSACRSRVMPPAESP